jgi:protein involved in polysaccharide export with SLBB domain
MQRRNACAALLLAVLLPGCATADSALPPLASVAPRAYTLGPGDELRVSVLGLDAMNNTYLVGDTGAISIPMLEPIDVQGKTIRDVEQAIGHAILARQLVLEPKVNAQIQAYRPFFISGEVQRPGQYPYVPGMSVMAAVSVAGGYTFRADKKRMTVTRAATAGMTGPTAPVMPGDLIVVRERWF